MKKTSQHFLTLAQKQQISTYTENFIYTMEEDKRGAQISLKKLLGSTNSTVVIQKFPANFVHSADASIVHSYNERFLIINTYNAKYNFYVNFGTNHDTFWSTMAPFLKLILKDCYLEFFDSKYLSTIDDLDPNDYPEAFKPKDKFKDINDRFMK